MDYLAFLAGLEAGLGRLPRPAWPADEFALHAAVVGVLRPGDPADLLFIRRAEVEGDPWSGHVAFPGGRVDPGDGDPWATAAREAREELGLDLAGVGRRLGNLPGQATLPLRGRRMLVHAFVHALPADPALVSNGEVHHTLWIPVGELLDGAGRGEVSWTWQGQTHLLPCRRLHGEVLWGMTLRMVEDLLRAWRTAG
jgi:8-oxo-dGTP pyrophosphatase MutT (NUDIX family)